MQANELKRGEWVEYNNHPVEVIAIDIQKHQATVWDEQTSTHQTLSISELIADPQCHCDSHQYY